FQPELKDATTRLRDVQFLLLQAHLQLGASAPAATDGPIPGLEAIQKAAIELLPHFAALRQVDRGEAVASMVKTLQEAGLGSDKAKQAIAQIVSDAPHNRV